MVGCVSFTNPTPDYINPEYPSYDNGVANSGIICVTLQISNDTIDNIGKDGIILIEKYITQYGQGFIVSYDFVNRYNHMIEDNNNKVKNAADKYIENDGVYVIIKNKYYFMTKHGMDNFLILNDLRKLQQTVTTKK